MRTSGFLAFTLCALGGITVPSPVRAQAPQSSLQLLESQAEAAYAAKRYPEALALYQKIVPQLADSERANQEYNEACTYALNGQSAEALQTLEAAIHDGWADLDHTRIDTDLATLHTSPRWPVLLEQMRVKTEAENKRWGTSAFETPYTENLSDADKLAGLSELWAEAKFGFANFWHVPALNWDETYRSFIPQVLATKSTEEYYDVLQRFYALLGDGHTGVWTPDQVMKFPLPVESHRIDGHVLVVRSLNPTFDLQGVQPGDEILAINGTPLDEWTAKNVAPYLTVSSPQDREARLWNAWYMMRGKPGTVFHVETSSPEGKHSTHLWTVGNSYPPEGEPFVFRTLPNNVAYVALNEFEDTRAAEQWDKHWDAIRSSSTVILDMRRNGGGSDNVGAHILSTLLDKPIEGPQMESPEWIATYRAWGQAQPWMKYPSGTLATDPAHHFSGRVIVLTGPGTFSAAEDFAIVFAASKRGTIVGEATGGSTGQPLSFKLPGGGGARVCTKHDRFPDGTEFIGIGVPPDNRVHITRDDLIHGTDSVLEKATQLATTNH